MAQGFAGIPVLETMQGKKQQVERGQSYYRGEGRNKATVSPEVVEEAIKKYGESFNVEGKKPDEVSTVRRQNFANIAQSPDQNIEVPIPIPATKVAANPPPSSYGGSDGTIAANQSGGTSLNSFIFTELQYT